jgi:hypothetical protein
MSIFLDAQSSPANRPAARCHWLLTMHTIVIDSKSIMVLFGHRHGRLCLHHLIILALATGLEKFAHMCGLPPNVMKAAHLDATISTKSPRQGVLPLHQQARDVMSNHDARCSHEMPRVYTWCPQPASTRTPQSV